MSSRKKIILLACLALSAAVGIAPIAAQDNLQNQAAPDITRAADALWLADFAAMRRLDELGNLASKQGDFADAAANWDRAAELSETIRGKMGGWMAFRAAEAHAKNGQQTLALEALSLAREQGFRLADQILASENFAAIEPKALQRIIADIQENDRQYRQARSLPENANLITEDISRFWAAYDRMKETSWISEKATILRKYYLALGSSGLIDYHWMKTRSMEMLAEKISKSPEYYDGIRHASLTVASYEPQIRNAFFKVKALYPDAYFPDVTFVIGRLNSGGTAGPSGMLIGVEVWSWSEGVPLDGVSPGFQKIVTGYALDSLPYVVVHEQMHAMQNYTGEDTLLKSALKEGSADFITMLALPDSAPPAHYAWGLKNEAAIWRRFEKQMASREVGEWIGNNSDATAEWPADLGYFVGARISEAYYAQADDKTQAIRDLLNVTDPQKILVQSGYGSNLSN